MLNRLVKPMGLLSIVLLPMSIFAQGNPNQTYPLEFEWQKTIASQKNKTIKDYFMLLPSSFINCEGAMFDEYTTFQKRNKIIGKLDVRNGYLEFYKTPQLVLFKDRKNKKDIIAIQAGRCGASNTCGALNTLLEFSNKQWRFRVDLLPGGKMMEAVYYRGDVCPYFDLPQFGTTISIKDENNKNSVITRLKWTGERFIDSDKKP